MLNWFRKALRLIIFVVLLQPVIGHTEVSDCVILLHGLARSERSFFELEEKLEARGYDVVNYHYPSTDFAIEKLASDAITTALRQCTQNGKVHFVTHSMGGILVRQYLHSNTIHRLGRVVMLGPPNHGSEVVDKLRKVPGFKMLNGPAGMQLGSGPMSVPNSLGPADFELGIIAGTRSINLILSTMLPNPDDGKVSVESTKLEGMADHIAMPVTHPFMMSNDAVIEQVMYFLSDGKFHREGLGVSASQQENDTEQRDNDKAQLE